MKRILVYSMRTNAGRHSAALINLHWELEHSNFSNLNSNFSPLRVFTNDHESAANMNLGLQINFSERASIQIQTP